MVDIFVTVLQNDGGAVEAGIICSSLALADAGIEVYDMVAACSVAVVRSQTLVDFTEEEGREAGARILVSAMGSLNEVTHVVATGEIEGQVLTDALQVGLDGASKVHSLMQECLKASVDQRKKKRKFGDE